MDGPGLPQPGHALLCVAACSMGPMCRLRRPPPLIVLLPVVLSLHFALKVLCPPLPADWGHGIGPTQLLPGGPTVRQRLHGQAGPRRPQPQHDQVRVRGAGPTSALTLGSRTAVPPLFHELNYQVGNRAMLGTTHAWAQADRPSEFWTGEGLCSSQAISRLILGQSTPCLQA